jgi:hypothetical protein
LILSLFSVSFFLSLFISYLFVAQYNSQVSLFLMLLQSRADQCNGMPHTASFHLPLEMLTTRPYSVGNSSRVRNFDTVSKRHLLAEM